MIDKEILRKVMEKACDNSSRIMKNIMHHGHGDSKDWIEGTCPECFCNPKYRSKWKYNLQQMVLEEEPLKYLEKFL